MSTKQLLDIMALQSSHDQRVAMSVIHVTSLDISSTDICDDHNTAWTINIVYAG